MRFQQLFKFKQKKLVSEVLDGETGNTHCPIPAETVENHYQSLFSSKGQFVSLEGLLVPPRAKCNRLLKPITAGEVDRALGKMKAKTAAGPDGADLRSLRGLTLMGQG